MGEIQMAAAEVELLHRAYAAFNRREIEAVLALMHADVDSRSRCIRWLTTKAESF
jgi:hypothetical protein